MLIMKSNKHRTDGIIRVIMKFVILVRGLLRNKERSVIYYFYLSRLIFSSIYSVIVKRNLITGGLFNLIIVTFQRTVFKSVINGPSILCEC